MSGSSVGAVKMATTASNRAKLIITVFIMFAIGLIVTSIMRGHPIEKSDLSDLYGCYRSDNQQLFHLTPDALITPTRAIAFTAHQGKYHAYLDLAAPMQVVRHGAVIAFEPAPDPAVAIEVTRRTPRSLLLRSDAGPPVNAILSECRP